MIVEGLTLTALLVGTHLMDRLVRPRPARNRLLAGRSGAGLWLLCAMTLALFGLFLALCGSVTVSACMTVAVQAVLLIASNAKHAMLGEPLLFSDLALVGAIFRHPQFYLSAVAVWQRVAASLAGLALLATLAWLFVPDPLIHLAGLALCLGSLAVLRLSMRRAMFRRLALVPDAAADVQRHGLLPCLLLYWLRWRASQDPPVCKDERRHAPPGGAPAPQLIVAIQCESFADPADLFPDPERLPGLEAARRDAWQWGQLQVSGFGAYTMRTEYGALFGRDEDVLGFRRYDPFLTALNDASYALPNRLKGWRSLFVHPHDMHFYGRDRIMPAGGFAELVGEGRFVPPAPGEGRYVTDAAMTDTILGLAGATSGPSLIYAVTIENHGPWAADGAPGSGGALVQSYMRLVRNSDAMLTRLRAGLACLRRPALLVFFGDHRPSIPGATAPGGDRHTPYVMLRLDAEGQIVRGDNRRVDLTPAGLHHVVLDTALGPPA